MAFPAARRPEGGFSLLEVLAALVIAASALFAFYASNGSAMLLQTRSDSSAAVAAIALDLLGSVGAEVPLRAGALRGEAVDGAAWRLEIEPVAGIAVNGRTVAVPALFRVRVSVRAARGGGSITLDTLRAGRG